MRAMDGAQETYWRTYYADVHRGDAAWLDYSNERVQAQTFALALEAAGPVAERPCLDAGCGRGHFARALLALGASRVTAVDIAEATITALRRDVPAVDWRAGSAADAAVYDGVEPCALVFTIEVLQYVPLEATLRLLWERVAPRGRLVGVVPNRDCPIVAKAIAKFDTHYDPPTGSRLAAALDSLPGRAWWALRGMSFQADQRVAPYAASEPSTRTDWNPPPNRFLLVAERT